MPKYLVFGGLNEHQGGGLDLLFIASSRREVKQNLAKLAPLSWVNVLHQEWGRGPFRYRPLPPGCVPKGWHMAPKEKPNG